MKQHTLHSYKCHRKISKHKYTVYQLHKIYRFLFSIHKILQVWSLNSSKKFHANITLSHPIPNVRKAQEKERIVTFHCCPSLLLLFPKKKASLFLNNNAFLAFLLLTLLKKERNLLPFFRQALNWPLLIQEDIKYVRQPSPAKP